MPQNFADRLLEAVATRQAPAVVAVDPVYSRLPPELAERRRADEPIDARTELEAILEFGRRVIQRVAPHVPAVKINSAYFERYHEAGVAGYHAMIREAKACGLLVIGDVKRGDVGHSAEQYARAHLAEPVLADAAIHAAPDAVTVNGYFGFDGVKPFIETARKHGRGVFVLVRTSNESAASVQDIVTGDGRKLHEVVAAEVARWAATSGTIGRHGYASIGAVVATRHAEDAARLRAAMTPCLFLVPGYGAQGGTAEDVRPYFKPDGTGAIVAAGRSVIYAYDQPAYRQRFGLDWEKCIEQACRDFAADLHRFVRACDSS